MRKLMLGACVMVVMQATASAGAVDSLLNEYKAAGAGPFSAQAGEQRWKEMHVDAESGKQLNCQTCHGENLKVAGKHEKTGKVIDPLAPSVNAERLTDVKFINKWFKRNCKQVLSRECTPQEKGDFLEFLRAQ